MRIWQLLVAVMLAAVVFGVAREQVGRVALVVFGIGLCEMFLGTSALMMLFQTVGDIGRAETIPAYAEAVGSTALVVLVGAVSMTAVLWLGFTMLQAVVA